MSAIGLELQFAFAYLTHVLAANTHQSPPQAIPYFEKACESGMAKACFNLAVLYNMGAAGIKKDPVLFEKYKAKHNEILSSKA